MSLEPKDEIEKAISRIERWKERCQRESPDGYRKLASFFVETCLVEPNEESKLTEHLKELGLTYELAESKESGPNSFNAVMDALIAVAVRTSNSPMAEDVKYAFFQSLVLKGFSLDPLEKLLDQLVDAGTIRS